MTRTAPSAALTLAFIAAGVCFARAAPTLKSFTITFELEADSIEELKADDAPFTVRLKKAVYQLNQHGQEPVNDYPRSRMAKDLAKLFSEIGNQLLLQNEQMDEQKTPDEERIPILRQLYLQQMRQIHEIALDGKSLILYNESLQSLGFYYFGSPGGGGSLGNRSIHGFAPKLRSLLEIHERIIGDSAGTGLTVALLDLRDKWGGFERLSAISHIVEREIVRPNPAGLFASPPPTPPERFMNKNMGRLMWQIQYELTKLDVELAEQKTPREERAKKLRNHFFEMIRKVEYIGQKVLVEDGTVKILFRDASGPILDFAGAPIAFEFPPTLMSALMIPSAIEERAKRLQQLQVGGGAALALLVLAGIFLVKRSGSAKEDDRSAETE